MGIRKMREKIHLMKMGGQRQAVLATLQVPSLQMFLAFLPQESKATCFHTIQQFFAEKTHEADGF